MNEQIGAVELAINSGIASETDETRLKELKKERNTLAKSMKNLASNAASQARLREKKRKLMAEIISECPAAAKKVSSTVRQKSGRPSLSENCPTLLATILKIATIGAPADPRRRSEVLASCATLDDLKKRLAERGVSVSRTALYYRLIPKRANSIDGKRHVETVPVKLARAQNCERAAHEDSKFAYCTLNYLTSVAGEPETEIWKIIMYHSYYYYYFFRDFRGQMRISPEPR